MYTNMAFSQNAVNVLQTLVIALGAGLGIWGVKPYFVKDVMSYMGKNTTKVRNIMCYLMAALFKLGEFCPATIYLDYNEDEE